MKRKERALLSSVLQALEEEADTTVLIPAPIRVAIPGVLGGFGLLD